MHRSTLTIIALLLLLTSLSCKSKRQNIDTSGNITPSVQKTIAVYGSESCDHCIDFRKQLDSAMLKYTFYDVEADERYFNEMMRKIQSANYRGYIGFPVVDVEGKIYVRPDFRIFISEINR